LVAVVGGGPAGLMAADVLASSGHRVTVFEKRPGPARKLFIAGSSGLNVSNSLPLDAFAAHYRSDDDARRSPAEQDRFWRQLLADFSPKAWLAFLEEGLGQRTFEGTSGRYFVESMHAGGMIRAWRRRLTELGVAWSFGSELVGFAREGAKWRLSFAAGDPVVVDALCLALGGGSYEPEEKPLRWPRILLDHGLAFSPLVAANVGLEVAWSEALVKEADGQPLKNVTLTTRRGKRSGDLVVTSYGLEGTPVYFVGQVGDATLDLKPDLSYEQVVARLEKVTENLAPLRRAKKALNLSPAALALLYHYAKASEVRLPKALAALVKAMPLRFERSRPIDEAISTAGGLGMGELNDDLMIEACPGVFAAGEMLDWDAPTGGFLLQACAAQGFRAGHGVARWLSGRG
jgi:uncharacterized flavoprotein (TIGR03862 family)